MPRTSTRPHYNATFAVLLLGVGACSLLQSLVVAVLPTLVEHLHTGQSTATWLMTGYLLSASVATPILGRIGDKVGKERLLSELLDRARQSGDVRAELTVMDAYACVLGLRSVIDDTAGRDADIWRRYLAIVLAGFRPAADPLAHPVVGDTLLIHADRSADRPERSR